MSNTDLGFLIIGVFALLLALLIVWVLRLFRRDQIFTGITPGQFPMPGQDAPRTRVKGGQEYSGPVAVQFTPPPGLSPGLVGTVVDGVAHMHDVTATIVDLAVRGYCTIETVNADGTKVDRPEEMQGKDKRRRDWLITQRTDINPNLLSPIEKRLLSQMFAHGPRVMMSQLTSRFGMAMREAQQNLYHEVVTRGWYPKHPRQSGPSCLGRLGVVVGILAFLMFAGAGLPGIWGALCGAMILAAFILLWRFGRGRVPRTAEGTAVRIQALGFKQYLETAEADQIKFEEAADIFSRYLPYAIVFGVAEHWAKVFGEVAARARMAGVDVTALDLSWFVLDAATDVLWYTSLFGGDMIDLVSAVDFGGMVAGATDGLAGFAEGVGDFVGSADLLPDLGDGCDGCDFDFF
ncbi:DUF2207 domain-containing protein [Enemella sp. A6]|uniref:DUF2207 domain-containing protein n=1 Tax=Enemella sp. A6 TaxID=3440152 RepID=UPI003EBD0E21